VTVDENDVAYAGVLDQAALLRSGELSVPDLVDVLLARIRRHDGAIRAFRIVRDDAAREEAKLAQQALDAGDARPLLGVPFAVKDNLDVAGETTEHGTVHRGDVARSDSAQVAAMRAAGMVCLGKTTMPELALWPFGENRATGITRNPWSLDRTSGGSSSGSAAAVAAGFVPVATATDGGGSIRIPAACSGLVGFKPPPGFVATGEPPHWHGLSSSGVLTRDVAGTAAVLDAIVDPTPRLTAALDEPIGPGFRVAWSDRAPTPAPLSEDMRRALEESLDALRAVGADVVRRDPAYGAITATFSPRYLAGVAEDAERIVPHRRMLEPRTRHVALLGSLMRPGVIERAHEGAARIRARIEEQYADVDLLVMPTIARPALPAGRWTHSGLVATASGVSQWVPFCAPWNALGLPAISVPAGLSSDGLPLAVQLVGRSGSESVLLRTAATLERTRVPLPRPVL
jgi:amidase